MAVTYGFYDSLNGDRKYSADQMSRIFEGIINDGVFASVGGALAVTAPGGSMNVNVASGRAWFNFTWLLNDSSLQLTVSASPPALNRIDTVVVEVNKDLGVRANSIKIVAGTAASSPVAPTLANTSTLKQYPLADIYVAQGVTQITQGNITNRIGTTACPFVTGPLTAIDASTFFGRFESDFYDWLGNLQDQLDANQAANLQNQIDALVSQNNFGWISVSPVWTYNSPTTVTVPTDATLKYKKGWGVRYKQGGAFKYGVIINVAATQLTIAGGSDYSVANAAITDISYSPDPQNAFGYPSFFNFTPIVSGGVVVPGNGTLIGRFSTIGRRVFWESAFIWGTTTSFTGSGHFQLDNPFVVDTPLSGFIIGSGFAYDIGVTRFALNVEVASSSAAVRAQDASQPAVKLLSIGSTVPFTWVTGDSIVIKVDATF